MQEFEYHRPATLAEAITLGAEGADSTSAVRYLAGGTDLILALEHSLAPPRCVIDLKAIPGLSDISIQPDGTLIIGALATMSQLARHPDLHPAYAALAEGAISVGGPPVRNRATLGGNLCNGSPAADTAPALLAFGGTVRIAGPGGERAVPASEFWQGPGQTALSPGEILTAMELPTPPEGTASAFERITRSAIDIALASAAALVTVSPDGAISHAVVALGALAPTPILVPGLDEALKGKSVDVEQAATLARSAARPIDDIRASADYRRDMAGVLAGRALAKAYDRALNSRGVKR